MKLFRVRFSRFIVDRDFSFFQQPEHDISDLRIKLFALIGFNFMDDLFFGKLIAVYTIRVHCVE